MSRKKQPTLLILVTLASVLLLAQFVLAACSSSTSDASAAPPAATEAAPSAATAVPAAPLPEGWVEHNGNGFSIGLPGGWQLQQFSDGDLEKMFAELQDKTPQLAEIVGSADQLQGVALWAFAPAEEGAVFVDNLNIRRSSLEGQQVGDLQEVADALVEQYKQLNFEEISARAGLEIDGHPAAYATYRVPFTGIDGSQATMQGHQYLVLTGTDLWILSYSFGPDSTAASVRVYEQSGQSFKAD